VISEIDRYIVWPGQALAYKIGQLKSANCAKKRRASWVLNLMSESFMTPCLKMARCP